MREGREVDKSMGGWGVGEEERGGVSGEEWGGGGRCQWQFGGRGGREMVKVAHGRRKEVLVAEQRSVSEGGGEGQV